MSLFTPDDLKPIHFMGVAGAGMSALALVARSRGVAVTGCDINPMGAADVARAGVSVLDGHDAGHVSGCSALIYTAAVPDDHPELAAARAAGIPVVRRAQALQALVSDGETVAIAGTHGKTTTTAMVAAALVAAGDDPTAIVGGRVDAWGGNARVGSDDLYVIEADEFDRSFLELEPSTAIVNNVEAEHLECYGSVDELESAFATFANRASRILIGADDRGAKHVATMVESPCWRVGFADHADIRLSDVTRSSTHTGARVSFPDGTQVQLELAQPGLHNARNATMALGVAHALGRDMTAVVDGLAAFGGVSRRFEVLGTASGITVVDDYAHHPTEVAVTVAAARQRFPGRRLVAVFQPHLYSRTKTHGEALGIALSTADVVVVTDVYAAREERLEGVSGQLVVQAAKRAGAVVEWVPERELLPARLKTLVRPTDVVVTMGAGNITETGPELLHDLEGEAA